MADKRLGTILDGVRALEKRGESDPVVSSVVYDSREAAPGALFFALKGVHTDGHLHIDQAVDAGAVAVVHSDPLEAYRDGVTYVRVANTRETLSPVSASWWGHPSRDLTVIGVTGTDGKSTTVSLIRQLLEFEEVKVGQLSTVSFKVGDQEGKNPFRQSTPEAPQIHGLLSAMLRSGQDHAVIEATSHGLSPRTSRLADVAFDVAVITNVTQEHLEFHGTLEKYRDDKAQLFRMIAASRNRDAFGVVNADDPYADLFFEAAGEKPVFTYSLRDENADLYATDLVPDASGTSFVLHTPMGQVETRLNLPNLFNVENVLAAVVTVAELRDEYPRDLAERLPALKGVKGRMERIAGNMPFEVIVDYAHSPGSFRKLLPFLKELAKERLIVVFGSAGERDRDKRPEQGSVASDYADLIVLADEDPRGEDPVAILEEIAAGVDGKTQGEDLFLITDRREALEKAFRLARPDDLVLALGKGHEESIITADGSIPWDEAEVCREVLRELDWQA